MGYTALSCPILPDLANQKFFELFFSIATMRTAAAYGLTIARLTRFE